MKSTQLRCGARAFTLVELLLVVLIIALLVGLLLPAVQAARESARRSQCINNLRQIGLSLHAYHDGQGAFPPGLLGNAGGAPGWGWGLGLLPYLEQMAPFNAANLGYAVLGLQNQTVVTIPLASFVCPSTGGSGPFDAGFLAVSISGRSMPAPAQYVASSGWLRAGMKIGPNLVALDGTGDGVFYRNSRTSIAEIGDGMSQTLFVGERSRNVADASWIGVPIAALPLCTKATWTVQACDTSMFMVLGRSGGPSPDLFQSGDTGLAHTPNALDAGPDGFWSLHPGICNFLFGDGAARPIRGTIDPRVFSALASRAGGEVTSADQF